MNVDRKGMTEWKTPVNSGMKNPDIYMMSVLLFDKSIVLNDFCTWPKK